MPKSCGYIALLGRPNAGKSTLLNALVGDKVAVVSRKPQTTRNRILGVAMQDQTQILFLDTPGIHRDRHNLINSTMNRVAMNTASEADILLYLMDATVGFSDEDATFLERVLQGTSKPLLILMTKVDSMKRQEVEWAQKEFQVQIDAFLEAHPDLSKDRILDASPLAVSAKRPESVQMLKSMVADGLPEGPWLFPEDDLTDMPRNFIASELVREQLFRQLGQEIPYGCAVKIGGLEFKPHMVIVRAQIILTRASHKPIVLGAGGSRIKALGTAARASLEKHFDQKVFLDLTVSVEEGWIDDQRMISELAHLIDQ